MRVCVYFNKHNCRGDPRQKKMYGLFSVIFIIPCFYSCNKTGKGGMVGGLRVVAENTNWLCNIPSL